MKVIAIQGHGGPDVLQLVDRELPAPGRGEVRVEVRAAGVNRADLLQRQGLYPPPPGVAADVPGLEYAGTVAELGPGCTLRQLGDPVMGLVAGGAYAQSLLVHERETIAVPEALPLAAAAGVPEAFLTAYRALFLEGGLGAGDWCVIRAATSGVGLAAGQLAGAFAAQALGTGRDAQRLARAAATAGFAATHVEGSGPLAEAVRAHSGGPGAAVVLDLLGGGHLQENLQAAAEEGTVVSVGLLAGTQDRIDLGALLMRRQRLIAMTMRSLPLERRIALARLFERRLSPLFAAGRLKPTIDRHFPLADAAEAHRHMAQNHHLGKLILLNGD